jgi:hypothetical protein
MKRKRNRAKQPTSLQCRLTEEAQRLRREAKDVPSSDERARLLSKAQQMEEAAELDAFFATPHGQRQTAA